MSREARAADVTATAATAARAEPPSWRMRLARALDRLPHVFDGLVGAARIVATGLPVGLLRRNEIRRLVHEAYADAPGFYDPAMYPIRYEERLLPLLERHGNGRRLLDLYCGHGREAEIFARAGYAVTAVDAQTEVVARARRYAERAAFEASFVAADVEHWTPPAVDWHVLYTSLWMYSTIPDRAARLAWLARLASWLDDGGLLVLSVTPRPPGRGAAVRHAIARFTAWLSLNDRRPELGDRFETWLFWHDFTRSEVLEEIDAAGLSLVDELVIGGGTPCSFFILRACAAGGA